MSTWRQSSPSKSSNFGANYLRCLTFTDVFFSFSRTAKVWCLPTARAYLALPFFPLYYTELIDGCACLYAPRFRSFELFDAQLIPYPDEHFDIVHARNVHTGVSSDFLMPKLYHTLTLILWGIAIFI